MLNVCMRDFHYLFFLEPVRTITRVSQLDPLCIWQWHRNLVCQYTASLAGDGAACHSLKIFVMLADKFVVAITLALEAPNNGH